MFKDTKAFSGFSVDDIAVAKAFYSETLGVDVGEANGILHLNIAGGNAILTEDVECVLARRPTSFDTWARDHRDAFTVPAGPVGFE